MYKSSIFCSLIASIFLFSAMLNVLHGYEHAENEPNTDECEICFVLLKNTDTLLVNVQPITQCFYIQDSSALTTKHYLTTPLYFIKTRAPPYAINPIKIS